MIYLKANQTNVIVVTWRERSINTSGAYRMILKNKATNDEFTYVLPYASDTSLYPNRYNKFSFSVGNIPAGQYDYNVIQRNVGDTAAVALVESGVAFVETAEAVVYEYSGTTNYVQKT